MAELESQSTIDELRKAIDSLFRGKAPGSDGISPEIVKAGRENLSGGGTVLFDGSSSDPFPIREM